MFLTWRRGWRWTSQILFEGHVTRSGRRGCWACQRVGQRASLSERGSGKGRKCKALTPDQVWDSFCPDDPSRSERWHKSSLPRVHAGPPTASFGVCVYVDALSLLRKYTQEKHPRVHSACTL